MESLLRYEGRSDSLSRASREEIEKVLNKWLCACGASTDRTYRILEVQLGVAPWESLTVRKDARTDWFDIFVYGLGGSYRVSVSAKGESSDEVNAMIDSADLLRQNLMDEESLTFKRMTFLHRICPGGRYVDAHLSDEVAFKTGFYNARILKAGLEFLANRGSYFIKNFCGDAYSYAWLHAISVRFAEFEARQEEPAKPTPLPPPPKRYRHEEIEEALRAVRQKLSDFQKTGKAAQEAISAKKSEIADLARRQEALQKEIAVLEASHLEDAQTVRRHEEEISRLTVESDAHIELVKKLGDAFADALEGEAAKHNVPSSVLLEALQVALAAR